METSPSHMHGARAGEVLVVLSGLEIINQHLRFPKSIPCDDILAALCILPPQAVGTENKASATARLPPHPLIYPGSCL